MSCESRSCLHVHVSLERAEEVSYRLWDLGANGVEQRDATTMTTSQTGQALLIAGYDSAELRDRAAAALAGEGADELLIEPVEVVDDGWSTGWRKYFKPVVLGRLQVIAPWMDPPRADRETIVIDPGMAFGTGGHATTRLVLSLLEQSAAESGMPTRVLDVGTGSGVLAIAAVKLGAREALGVDIEMESVEATVENARVNGVGDRVRAELGGAEVARGAWPLVLANIQLAVFQKCAADISERVDPQGEAFLSGLLADQIDVCLELFPGFEVTKTLIEDGWAALALRRALR